MKEQITIDGHKYDLLNAYRPQNTYSKATAKKEAEELRDLYSVRIIPGTGKDKGKYGVYFSAHKHVRSEIDKLIANDKHHGYVKNKVYVTLSDEKIKIGDKIGMNFMCRPDDMPTPWRLTKAKNVINSHEITVTITVKAKNGKTMTFRRAHYYSPYLI